VNSSNIQRYLREKIILSWYIMKDYPLAEALGGGEAGEEVKEV
jgi:hypothetical protein